MLLIIFTKIGLVFRGWDRGCKMSVSVPRKMSSLLQKVRVDKSETNLLPTRIVL